MAASRDLLLALQATAEICGHQFSEAALSMLASDLQGIDEGVIVKALQRCRMELKGRISASEILSRIDDGHPGPEEAWALVPRNEDDTTIMTQEIASAFGVAWPMIKAGEEVAARMVFKEVYGRTLADARLNHKQPKWFPSLGHGKNGREGPLLNAVACGRLTHTHVVGLLPPPDSGARLSILLAGVLDGKCIPPPAMNEGEGER